MSIQTLPAEFILRACLGKHAFDTRREAELAARRINRSGMKRRPVCAYACKACQSFHIGGKRKSAEVLPML